MTRLLLTGLLALLPSTAGAQSLWAYSDTAVHHYVGDVHTITWEGWCVADGYKPGCSAVLLYNDGAATVEGIWPGAEYERLARPDVCASMHSQSKSCDDESWQYCGNTELGISVGWRQDCVGIRATTPVQRYSQGAYRLRFVAWNGQAYTTAYSPEARAHWFFHP